MLAFLLTFHAHGTNISDNSSPTINDHNSVVFNVNGNEEVENASSGNLDAFYDYARANKDGLRKFLVNVK